MSDQSIQQVEFEAVRRDLERARALIDGALARLVPGEPHAEQAPAEHVAAERVHWPAGSSLPGINEPLALDDLDLAVMHRVVQALPPRFDTYHVVEHPVFRDAHRELLDRPAINQLVGKALRRNSPALGISYVGQRGRRRSALWHQDGSNRPDGDDAIR